MIGRDHKRGHTSVRELSDCSADVADGSIHDVPSVKIGALTRGVDVLGAHEYGRTVSDHRCELRRSRLKHLRELEINEARDLPLEQLQPRWQIRHDGALDAR